MSVPDLPNFRARGPILQHVRKVLAFYDPAAFDPTGGFFHFLKDDGTVFNKQTRHLVSSARHVFIWAMAARHFPGTPSFERSLRHALQFLREVHLNPKTGGYAWQLEWDGRQAKVVDSTNHCYGLAFVLLAHAHAALAGVEGTLGGMYETYQLMERHFWLPEYGLYADEADASWQLTGYRGQNANMHATEACLAAFQASEDPRFLERAILLADNVVRRQSSLTDGLMIWEHYQADWSVDWEYNRHDSTNIFRPWGYQPGHFTEWAKLLLLIERHQPLPWLLPRAEALFNRATECAWDIQNGGLYYGFAPGFTICDDKKYHWVQAETLACAALLGARTGKPQYWDWYDRIWAYCWRHWVDHHHGAWFRILSRENRGLTDEKSPAGKVDYHPMGACYDIAEVLKHS